MTDPTAAQPTATGPATMAPTPSDPAAHGPGRPRRRPEVLAPAGSPEALTAALAAGADAVYFGLDEGFNARGRAQNFPLAELPATMATIHRAGARGYITLNTLVFESELEAVERIVRAVAAAGVDAIIVQDPAVARIAAAVCPDLQVHASTQMTLSSPEAARFAQTLGVTRMVAPRECSVSELRALAAGTDLEIEVFVHGALCVSWSGQCLTSEAWGGRSANRGRCAQSCRLPYDLEVDGAIVPLGDVLYLLSPKDLAGVRAVAELAEIGIRSLKIEGRQKGPAYVSTAVETYRRLAARSDDPRPWDARDESALDADLARMALSYSRGFSHGFLHGSDHQTLVEGRFPKHRGAALGVVAAVQGSRVKVTRDPSTRPWTGALVLGEARPAAPEGVVASPLAAPAHDPEIAPVAGAGVVFDRGRPEDDEAGGRIFTVEATAGGWWLGFGQPGPDLRRVGPGQRVWLTSDPTLAREAASQASVPPTGRLPVALRVRGRAGEPLQVEARCGPHLAAGQTTMPLTEARGEGLTMALIRDKLGAFGGTPFHLAALDGSRLDADLHLPVSALKRLRRELVTALDAAVGAPARRELAAEPVVPALRRLALARTGHARVGVEAQVVPLCREDAQLQAVIDLGLPAVELDWMEMVGLARAVARARAAGLSVTIATVRVQKPGEDGYDRRLAALDPDGVLVRHWGGAMHFLDAGRDATGAGAARRPAVHGDFSLNVTNSLTASELLGLGLDTLTCAHDLDRVQVLALLAAAPAERFTVALHHHVPTFHTEHCVYAHVLSAGRDFRSCGRPCEQHQVSLRDTRDLVHPVVVDVACRNTVFNARAQSAASLVPELLAAGVRRFRVEFVREDYQEARRVLEAYRDLLEGRIGPAEAVRRASVHEQFGVTSGTMRVLG